MPSSQLPLNPTTYYNQPYAIPFWHESLDRAYQEVLIAEQAAMTSHDEDKTINARVLGYFLLECFKRMHRFGPDAVDRIVVEIISMPTKPDTTTQDVIYGLGAEYRAYLLRGIRTTPTAPATPSLHPSRPSMDTLDAEILSVLQAPGTNYQASEAKALARDQFRCCVTGAFDHESTINIPSLGSVVSNKPNVPIDFTQACHILNESVMTNIRPEVPGDEKSGATTKLMSMLTAFGLETLAQDIMKDRGIHHPSNLLTLIYGAHKLFDHLDICFDEIGENVYHIWYDPARHGLYFSRQPYFNPRVDFSVPPPSIPVGSTANEQAKLRKEYDLRCSIIPDARLLGLHAACTHVAHMSGAGEKDEEIQRKVESTTVLASEGTDGSLLYDLLVPHRLVTVQTHSQEAAKHGILEFVSDQDEGAVALANRSREHYYSEIHRLEDEVKKPFNYYDQEMVGVRQAALD